jgi:ribonuclease P protein component
MVREPIQPKGNTGDHVAKGSFRFAKKEHISQPQDFRRVMRLGRRISSRNFILFFQKNENMFHRLGIVAKKEIGPATFRNQMKRYLREFFRLHKHQIKNSYDIILMVKKGCSLSRYQEVEEELREIFIL